RHHRRTLVEWIGNPGDELDFTAAVFDDEPKNYHGWQHRQWSCVISIWSANERLTIQQSCFSRIRITILAWNYRYFILQLLLISGGLISRPDVIEWAEKLYSETENRAHYLVSFLLDIEMEKIEEVLQGSLRRSIRYERILEISTGFG
ncbi:unnamed protein product, partial [Mesorhabditis belari]|uniref:Farnesyltransferase alpha subunit n=1 Tax=Mesorhabditis belari TaxID=2138241 RepID=A0AAF3EHH3_9BILA